MENINNNLEEFNLFASRFTVDADSGIFTTNRTGFSDRKPNKGNGYIDLCTTLNGKNMVIKAHRLAWFIYYGEMPAIFVDHINEDKADNRKCNLQLLDNRSNVIKSIKAKGGASSRYTGVSWVASRSKWQAAIRLRGKQNHLGYFTNELDAAQAYLDYS